MNRTRYAVVATLALTTTLALADTLPTKLDRFALGNECKPVMLSVEGLPDDAAKIGLTTTDIERTVRSRLRAARLYIDGLVPGHCDPTVNLYDGYVCARGDWVEALWPIAARGCVW